MIKTIATDELELAHLGYKVDDADFKSHTYFQFDTVEKTVTLYTADLPVNLSNLINLSELGYDFEYYPTLEHLDKNNRLPDVFTRHLTWLELKLYHDIEVLREDILLLEATSDKG